MSYMNMFREYPSEIGEFIGTESCIDLKGSDEEEEEEEVKLRQEKVVDERQGRGRRLNLLESMMTDRREKKEFPPPIPYLARTENLSPHMPWTLKRYYSGDGRLIIKEVKVEHHDYFRVNRSDGRLTLELVSLEHDFLPLGLAAAEEEEEEEEDEDRCLEGAQEGDADADADTDADADAVEKVTDQEEQLLKQTVEVTDQEEQLLNQTVEEEIKNIQTVDPSEVNKTAEEETAKLNSPGGGGGGGGKCWEYSGIQSACFFKATVPYNRPVHI